MPSSFLEKANDRTLESLRTTIAVSRPNNSFGLGSRHYADVHVSGYSLDDVLDRSQTSDDMEGGFVRASSLDGLDRHISNMGPYPCQLNPMGFVL